MYSHKKIYFRNRLLLCILNICKDILGRLPKVVGIDVVEMALWAKVTNKFILITEYNCPCATSDYDSLIFSTHLLVVITNTGIDSIGEIFGYL